VLTIPHGWYRLCTARTLDLGKKKGRSFEFGLGLSPLTGYSPSESALGFRRSLDHLPRRGGRLRFRSREDSGRRIGPILIHVEFLLLVVPQVFKVEIRRAVGL
jgi:hypothetical protein